MMKVAMSDSILCTVSPCKTPSGLFSWFAGKQERQVPV